MLENLKPKLRQFSCKVRLLIEELEPTDAEILTKAIADERGWPANTLSHSLRDLGIQVGQEVIRRHRTGVCSCSKNSNQL